MSLVKENIDKSKGVVTEVKELDSVHQGVLEILKPTRLPEITKTPKVESKEQNTRPVPTKYGLKLQDALLRGKTSLLFGPKKVKKETASDIVARIANLRIIDEQEAIRYNKRKKLVELIQKINEFVLDAQRTSEKYEEIMSDISDVMQHLNLICSSAAEICNYRSYLSSIRVRLINIYSEQYGRQKVR